MLSYILPPIIIIVSVSVLITFLFRKVATLPEQQQAMLANENHSSEKKLAQLTSGLGHLVLKVLERMMHKLKLLSLKFHNQSNDWFQTIREKRQQSVQVQKQQNLEQKQAQTVESLSAPERPYSSMQTPAATKIVRPMIRETVTRPQRAAVTEKNQLEDVLIKRIAVNPKDIEAYERLGDYYLENENFQDSLECFKQVLRLSPVHHKARLRIRRLERMVK